MGVPYPTACRAMLLHTRLLAEHCSHTRLLAQARQCFHPPACLLVAMFSPHLTLLPPHLTLQSELESEREIAQFKELLTAISSHLVKTKRTWKDITRADCGPYHRGWSRLLSSLKKSRDVYRLIQRNRREGEPRSENEQKLQTETNIMAMTDRRWNSVYKNLSLLKCNLRIKHQRLVV